MILYTPSVHATLPFHNPQCIQRSASYIYEASQQHQLMFTFPPPSPRCSPKSKTLRSFTITYSGLFVHLQSYPQDSPSQSHLSSRLRFFHFSFFLFFSHPRTVIFPALTLTLFKITAHTHTHTETHSLASLTAGADPCRPEGPCAAGC